MPVLRKKTKSFCINSVNCPYLINPEAITLFFFEWNLSMSYTNIALCAWQSYYLIPWSMVDVSEHCQPMFDFFFFFKECTKTSKSSRRKCGDMKYLTCGLSPSNDQFVEINDAINTENQSKNSKLTFNFNFRCWMTHFFKPHQQLRCVRRNTCIIVISYLI